MKWLAAEVIVGLSILVSAGAVIGSAALSAYVPIELANPRAATQIDQKALIKYQAERKVAEAKAKAEADTKAKSAKQIVSNHGTPGAKNNNRLVTYSVAVKGKPSSNLSEFRVLAAETLNDPRGWPRAGVQFKEVTNGGDFTLILSEPQYLPSFSPVCSEDWSCRVGRDVIINDKRWATASEAWKQAGGDIRNYRHMVVNHEVGHFLGHMDNEQQCAGVGQPAPLMDEQSMGYGLQDGCKFNPWPLESELWTNF